MWSALWPGTVPSKSWEHEREEKMLLVQKAETHKKQVFNTNLLGKEKYDVAVEAGKCNYKS